MEIEKPENMFEPSKLPFEGGADTTNPNQSKNQHTLLDGSKFNLLQFPAQFAYKLGPNSKSKLRLKKVDENKLHENKEILQFNVQKQYDSAGNPIRH